MFDFIALTQECAPMVATSTMTKLVKTESGFNPYAIGVVGAHLERQPKNREEAIATAEWLESRGYNYSVGLSQVNKKNFKAYGLTTHSAFDACTNLRAGGQILSACYTRAKRTFQDAQGALLAAFSCYYSGNFVTGFKEGYVLKVVSADESVTRPAFISGTSTRLATVRLSNAVKPGAQTNDLSEIKPRLAENGSESAFLF